MSAQHGLDRHARFAVLAVVLVFLVIVGMAVRSCVGAMTPETIVAQSQSGNDQIIEIGNQTIFLERGSVASKVMQWINSGATDPRAFPIEDPVFQPDSDELTKDGKVRLQRFVDIMTKNRLTANLFVTTYEGTDAAERQQLAAKRANRIRGEMIGRGVPEAQISTAVERISWNSAGGRGKAPTMVLVLSKKPA